MGEDAIDTRPRQHRCASDCLDSLMPPLPRCTDQCSTRTRTGPPSAVPRRSPLRRLLAAVTLGLLLVLPTVTIAADDDPSFHGTWSGRLEASGQTYTLRIVIAAGPSARLTSVEENDSRLADRVRIDGTRIDLRFRDLLARFQGVRVAPDRIEGQWRQTLYRLPLTLVREAPESAAAAPR